MTLTITATGERAEIEEVTDAGYYLTVAGRARFFEAAAVTHPAPTAPRPNCPDCGGRLSRAYETFGSFIECEDCFYCKRAPALLDD